MRNDGTQLLAAAGDLANHLACRHLTELDRAVATGKLEAPQWRDPALALLQERGLAHEEAYVEHLRRSGVDVVELRDLEGATAIDRTVLAMREGAGAIVQASLRDGRWGGRADVLIRIDEPSELGDWSYEVVDTKLAQDTRGGTVLQLCLYSDLVGRIQGQAPERMHVVKPGENFKRETFRFADFQAYYRLSRERLEEALSGEGGSESTYPVPCAHCDICRWWRECDTRRHTDDHLSLVAGLRTLHTGELERQGVRTLEQFAEAPEPLRERPQRGHLEAFERAHGQAGVQFDGRRAGRPVYELLPAEPGAGLSRLPEPAAGDLFFDIESDPFVDGGGLEYLLGVSFVAEDGTLEYRAFWGLDRAAERRAFEEFIDFVSGRLRTFPAMHIYHFSPYETGAVKRLMGRHGTREAEVDQLLRGERFVDLLAVTRQGLRASVESYSLKQLEPFYGFVRETELREASAALRRTACALEVGAPGEVPGEDLQVVEAYNREDCESTAALRDWLEERRAELVASGGEIARPELVAGDASEAVEERTAEVQAVFDRLVGGLQEDQAEWGGEERARWLLAHQLEYFHREDRCAWWEFFRLHELADEDLLDERKTVVGLEYVGDAGGTAKCPMHVYRFPPQEAALSEGNQLHEVGGDAVGTVVGIDQAQRTLHIKKQAAAAGRHPRAVLVNERVNPRPIDTALLELARSVGERGVDGDGPYRAARDLLMKHPPRLVGSAGGALRKSEEDVVAAAVRIAGSLDHGMLPIQGPPGSGKTCAGARMIVALVCEGKRVGVTAVSHKVIRNLLDEVLVAAREEGVDLSAVHKVSSLSGDAAPGVQEVKGNDQALAALAAGNVVGGTAWLWARDDMIESVDYLFVDEAGQMSLAQVLGAARSAHNLVLLGDPQQLEQPQRGAHPEGAEVSALVHVLDGHKTIADEAGLFLDVTWRLHPEICDFTSELYYEGRLRPKGGLERQAVIGNTPFAGSGLFYVPVEHEGNQNRSLEEVEAVVSIVDNLLASGISWVDAEGVERPLDAGGILVVAPYNAQVGALSDRLPAGVRVGTVDKFQGQQAPVVIYSAATSSAEEAPRGMSFLYNPNRLNVATSRARCACILVAAPKVIEPDCRTPEQMRWANGLCRFRELARVVDYTGGVLRTPASVRTQGNH
jgi:predicted RecB family nuclease